MFTFKRLLAGALLACCLAATAWAGPADDPYGFAADDVAENQGVVAYWYAHGFANAFGHFPENWAEVQAHGMPLRDFVSPHTGEAINLDDGTLDFDGDMMYVTGDWDVEVHVQTSAGVTVLPGTLPNVDECRTACCEIMICGIDCWDVCGDEDAICKILSWMMWESFETYECRYGTRPCDEKAWMASGFAPIGMNWKEMAPFMDIEYVWGNCYLKKAYVNCCQPCNPCAKPCCAKTDCNKCDKCKPACAKPCCEKKDCNSCDKCGKDKCVTCKQDTCTTCKPKCSAENKCGKCDTCKPKCKPDCQKPCCKKDNCVKCKQDTCTTCKPKCSATKPCGKCDTCKPKCKPDCQKPCCKKDNCVKCKQDTCTTCKPKCSAENKCGKCDMCKPKCTMEKPCGKCDTCKPKCKSDCGGCDKCGKDKCVSCKQDTCTTCKPKCEKC